MANVSELQPLKLLQLSDLHLFPSRASCLDWGETPLVNPADALDAVLNHVEQSEEHYDVVIVTGDVAQDPSPRTYSQLPELFAPLNAPVYLLPGNHDHSDLLQQLNDQGNCSTEDVIVIGCWALFLLDSSIRGSDFGYFSETQLDKLEQLIRQYSHLNQLIAFHHHPVAIDSPWLDKIALSNADELLQRLAPYPQVKGILAGHVHQAHHSVINNIDIWTCPSTSLPFAANTPEQTFSNASAGYRTLTLHIDGCIETKVVNLQSPKESAVV